ncbi:toprim domain-containing protein [Spirosoma liriopis]|nr:toprim domain-containing protein [Spirosoma liriopis]
MLKSPFRNERTASFHVDPTGRMWTDHGDGESQGGGLVKLVQRWYRVDVSGALKIIAQVMGESTTSTSISPVPLEARKQTPLGVEVRCVQKLTDIKLIEYAEGRGIPRSIAVKYLNECYYSINGGGNFHALAFRNDEGGYELRAPNYQYSSSPKAITTIAGVDGSSIAVFEGFFDFLSALAYFKREVLQTDALILNSLSHVGKALAILKKYKHVHLFLDNDPAGQGEVTKITSKCNGVVNWSDRLYPGIKDFNEFLITVPHERDKVT